MSDEAKPKLPELNLDDPRLLHRYAHFLSLVGTGLSDEERKAVIRAIREGKMDDVPVPPPPTKKMM